MRTNRQSTQRPTSHAALCATETVHRANLLAAAVRHLASNDQPVDPTQLAVLVDTANTVALWSARTLETVEADR